MILLYTLSKESQEKNPKISTLFPKSAKNHSEDLESESPPIFQPFSIVEYILPILADGWPYTGRFQRQHNGNANSQNSHRDVALPIWVAKDKAILRCDGSQLQANSSL